MGLLRQTKFQDVSVTGTDARDGARTDAAGSELIPIDQVPSATLLESLKVGGLHRLETPPHLYGMYGCFKCRVSVSSHGLRAIVLVFDLAELDGQIPEQYKHTECELCEVVAFQTQVDMNQWIF